MLLTKLAPDRATPILARGRAFGESRIVCGVHNASAVEAGRLSATVTLATMDQTSDFKDDLAAAQAEIAALRADHRNASTRYLKMPRRSRAGCAARLLTASLEATKTMKLIRAILSHSNNVRHTNSTRFQI